MRIRELIARWWRDDEGALLAPEFLFLGTIMVSGVVVGMSTVRNAVNTEMNEFSNSILALSQEYTVHGLIGCCSYVEGSATVDFYDAVPQTTRIIPGEPVDVNQVFPHEPITPAE